MNAVWRAVRCSYTIYNIAYNIVYNKSFSYAGAADGVCVRVRGEGWEGEHNLPAEHIARKSGGTSSAKLRRNRPITKQKFRETPAKQIPRNVSRHSESAFRVGIPSRHSESAFRVGIPSRHSESAFRVAKRGSNSRLRVKANAGVPHVPLSGILHVPPPPPPPPPKALSFPL